jgi:hypothetical protein
MKVFCLLALSFLFLKMNVVYSQQYPLVKLNEKIEKVEEVQVITSNHNSKELVEKLKLFFETIGSEYQFKNNIDSNSLLPFTTSLKETDKEFKTKLHKQNGYVFTIVSPDGLCTKNCLRILLVNYKSEKRASCDCKKIIEDENSYNPFNNLTKCYYQNGTFYLIDFLWGNVDAQILERIKLKLGKRIKDK